MSRVCKDGFSRLLCSRYVFGLGIKNEDLSRRFLVLGTTQKVRGFQAIWRMWEVPGPIVDMRNFSCTKKALLPISTSLQ